MIERLLVFLSMCALAFSAAGCAASLGAGGSASAPEVIEVELSTARASGCDVRGSSLRLSDALVVQDRDRPIVIEAEAADVLVFQKDKALVELKRKKKGIDQDYHVEAKPWTVQKDPKASGGEYIDWVAYAEYRFQVTTPGRYVRWMRYAVPGPSFFHLESIDDEEPFWDLEEPTDAPRLAWLWKPAEVRYKAPRRRVYYDLDAGDHTLKLHTYYNGARLDKIVLTRDLDWRPEGKGPAPTPKRKSPRATVIMEELTPPAVRAWRSVEVVAADHGGKVTAEYSTNGAKTFQALAADGSLAGVKAAGDGSDRITVRLTLERSPNGESPTVSAVRVRFDGGPESVVTLENGKIRIRFDRRTGKLLTLERIGSNGPVNQAWQASSLFDVSLKKPGKPEITVLGHDEAKLSAVKILEPKRRVRFEYALAEGQVKLDIEIRLDETCVSRWRAHVVNNLKETDVIRLKFPILKGLRIGPEGRDDVLAVPDHSGKLVTTPGRSSRRRFKYPGSASLCFMDLCDETMGVYLAAYDPDLINTAVERKPTGTGDRVDLMLEKCNRIRARGFEATYDFAVGVHEGDWHRGADIYRTWFHKTLGTASLPRWFAESDGYLALHIQNYAAKFKTLPQWFEQARWMGLNHLQCWGQSNGPRGNCCPTYYYPCPAYGTVEEFAAANKAIRDAGGHIGYYFHSQAINRLNLSRARIHSYFDREQIPPHLQPPPFDFYFRVARIGPDGKFPGPPSYISMRKRFAIGKHANDFARVVMWAPAWQAYVQFWTVWQYAAQWNVDCFYFDVLGASDARESFNPYRAENGEGYHGMGQMGIVTEVIQKGKPYVPEPGIIGEGCCDSYGRLAAHMISGFDKSPEVFRYTMPDQVVFDGHSNTGHAKPASIFDKVHLYGMRFDLIVRSAYTREHVWFRRQFKHWLYKSRFIDDVGLLEASAGLQVKLHARTDPDARGLLLTLVNPHRLAGGKVTVSTKAVGRIRSAFAYRMWGLPERIPFTAAGDKLTFTAPDARVSAVLLAAEATGREAVQAAARLETRPGECFASVALCNLTASPQTVTLTATDPAGFKLPKETTVRVGAGDVVTKRFSLGERARLTTRRFVKFALEGGTGDLVVPAAAVLTDGTFESLEAQEPALGYYVDGQVAASGAKSACLAAGPKKTFLAAQFLLDVKPATRYRLTLKLKRTTKGNIFATLRQKVRDGRSRQLGAVIGKAKAPVGTWETFRREFETSPDVFSMKLYIYNRATNAKVWIDDLSVEELAPAKAP